jgi:hypothetical protein
MGSSRHPALLRPKAACMLLNLQCGKHTKRSSQPAMFDEKVLDQICSMKTEQQLKGEGTQR